MPKIPDVQDVRFMIWAGEDNGESIQLGETH